MPKQNNDTVISFVGKNSSDVTGSCIHIRTPNNQQILLECGLYQSNNFIESYAENSKPFKFKPSEIDYCFVMHPHIDHTGLIPRLVREGFSGKVISTYETKQIAIPLLENSQYIISSEAERLAKRKGNVVSELYSKAHVNNCFELWNCYEYNKDIKLNEFVSFRLLHNSHTLGAAQLLLSVKNSAGATKTILYTSDLGSKMFKQYYTEDTDTIDKCNILIAESTYGKRDVDLTHKNRHEELSLLKETIKNTCNVNKSRLLIPSFSFGRSQYIVSLIYDLFKHEQWQPKVVIDSALTCEINNVYETVLSTPDKRKWQEVLSWDKLECIGNDYPRSLKMQSDLEPKVIITSSGFLNGGRSVQYLKGILPKENNMIAFIGYASPNTLAGKIKSGDVKNTITIEKVKYKNLCKNVSFKTFSSHIQRNEMIDYYTSINCEKVFLVHGDSEGKEELKDDLKKEFRKKLKTTNVISVKKNETFKI